MALQELSLLDRRRFLALSAASTCLAGPAASLAAALSADRFAERDYARAMVIDAMGALVEPEQDLPLEAPPSNRLLVDLRASGITALSMTLNVGRGTDRFNKAIHKIATFDEKVAAAPDALIRIRTAGDLRIAKATGRVGLIYNVQDTLLLENDLSRVALLQRLGVRVMQLTYNIRNLVGDGCLEPADGGLSNLGRELIAEINHRRVVMDLSHGGRRTIAEAIAQADAPPVISHTGCRDLVDYPRNVFDTELKALADRGGVVGIYFMPFLASGGTATSADLIRHLEHAVNVCGEDHVGIGTDGRISATQITDEFRQAHRKYYEARKQESVATPGEGPTSFELVTDYNEPGRLLRLAEDLSRRGWPGSRVERVLGRNFARVFSEVWG